MVTGIFVALIMIDSPGFLDLFVAGTIGSGAGIVVAVLETMLCMYLKMDKSKNWREWLVTFLYLFVSIHWVVGLVFYQYAMQGRL